MCSRVGGYSPQLRMWGWAPGIGVFSGSASCIDDFEFDTPVTQPVPGNPETIPGIHNSHWVGLGGIYSTPQDKLLPEEVVTLIRCSVGDTGLNTCFFWLILDSQWMGMGTRAYHIVSMPSEALIALGEGKYGYLWPFLFLGLATLCVCASLTRFCLALPFLASLLQDSMQTGFLDVLALGPKAVGWGFGVGEVLSNRTSCLTDCWKPANAVELARVL